MTQTNHPPKGRFPCPQDRNKSKLLTPHFPEKKRVCFGTGSWAMPITGTCNLLLFDKWKLKQGKPFKLMPFAFPLQLSSCLVWPEIKPVIRGKDDDGT